MTFSMGGRLYGFQYGLVIVLLSVYGGDGLVLRRAGDCLGLSVGKVYLVFSIASELYDFQYGGEIILILV